MDPDVMGETMGIDIMGEDDATVGAAVKRRLLSLPKRPNWRSRLAPGVPGPGEGLEPLALTPDRNNGVFNAANPFIQFQARVQVPFRAERLLVSVLRAAALAPAGDKVLCQGIFIGRDLANVEFASFDIEFFVPGAFGVRLKLRQAEPGVLINLPCIVGAPITAGDITVTMMLLGHSVQG